MGHLSCLFLSKEICSGSLPGSGELDHSSSIYSVLTPEMGVEALLTGAYGLVPKGTVGLLIGRGSVTRQGIFVAPDVED